MSRYIDADKALRSAIEEKRFFIHFEDALNEQFVVDTIYSDLADFLNSQPTADVVEVVRCKDCLHRSHEPVKGYYRCYYHVGKPHMHELPNSGVFVMVKDDGFCSYGERKEV